MPDEFLKSKADPNATEEKLIESCKEFATNKMSNLLSYIRKSIKAIVGYQEDTLAHSDFNTTIDKLVENLKHFYSESETALETPFPNNKNFTRMIKDLSREKILP